MPLESPKNSCRSEWWGFGNPEDGPAELLLMASVGGA